MKTAHYLSLNSRGLHRLSYTEWGTPNLRPLICVHGQGRNGRDFDYLAKALSLQGYWVICPDIVGCGHSDWLVDSVGYCVEQYLHDLLTLVARLNVEHIDWLGSSMGGLLGIMLSGYANTPIKRLILNDIGPDMSHLGGARGRNDKPGYSFASLDVAERHFRRTLNGFGRLSDEQWRHLTKCSIKPNTQGGYALRCDPAIRIPDFTDADQQRLWDAWQQVRCPSLVLRGEQSTILLPETIVKMKQHHRRLSIHEIAEVGHAPFLASAEQIEIIASWLKVNAGQV